ncbi:MAG TPA: hypothetical protein GXX51_06505 [Firmicutes bacterium]|nr:hypothetical protein [Bacillota bacterium]
MTGYERIMAAIKREPVDHIPVFPLAMTFAARYARVSYRDYCRIPEVMVDAQITMARDLGFDAVHPTCDAAREAETLGAEVIYPEDDVPSPVAPIITCDADLERLSLPDLQGRNRMRDQIDTIKALKDRVGGELAVFGWVEAPFQLAAILSGVNDFMIKIVTEPDHARRVIEFCAEISTQFGLAQIEAGADVIGVGDAVASLISRDHYLEFSLPYAAAVIRKLKERGVRVKYHICGDSNRLLDVLPRTGADIINLDSHVDLAVAKAVIGDRVCIKGNLPPVLLLNGTEEEVVGAVRKCISAMGDGRGYIFSPGCEVPRDAPVGNVRAMVAATGREV